MARKQTTKYAILGMLSIRPMSGYDIKKMISESIGNFWQESYGQLYPALEKLVDEKLVRHQSPSLESGRAKKIYALTKTGQKTLAKWLEEPVSSIVIRNELLLKLFFGHEMTETQRREHIENHKTKAQEKLKSFKMIEKTLRSNKANSDKVLHWITTLKYGQCIAEAEIKWAKEILTSLAP